MLRLGIDRNTRGQWIDVNNVMIVQPDEKNESDEGKERGLETRKTRRKEMQNNDNNNNSNNNTMLKYVFLLLLLCLL